ncbi:hypothetical protein NDA18_000604 [Ustilago nuda]|nr:hypothetical protein NDA18_000604 [Ustilago nuda]
MICAKTILVAFMAISISLMTVTQAAERTISQNAAVGRHTRMMKNRAMRRSIAVAQGKMIPQRRQTGEQIAQAAALKQWDDDFHAKNAGWQQAAIAALGKGQTPPTFDEYWQGKSGVSSSSSADSSLSLSFDSPAPAQKEKKQQEQSTTNNSNNNSNNNDDASSQDSSEDCSDQEEEEEKEKEEVSASTTTGEASSCAKGVAAAAATGSKNQATNGKGGNNNNNTSAWSSQATWGHYSGQATYYAPGLGACGWRNGEADYIVAISASLFDSFGRDNPNKNAACGHKIAATYGGKTITVSVADRCVSCALGDLDFTSTGFSQFADKSQGRLDGLSWSWIGDAPQKRSNEPR